MIPKLEGTLIFGGDYNPEQWPESVWHEDMRLMRQAGVNLVSVGIFSWARIQPNADTFDFAWLDTVMALLSETGIRACLATATASPPAWLIRKDPSVLPLNREGRTLYPGSRQHYSPCSGAYRKAATRLVEAIAERYAHHPALAAWHVNNEYACHMTECHGEETTNAFRLWLKERYGNLDALNFAWGTQFWSQVYSDWEEIYTPREAPYFTNPTQQLDYRRFMSDAFLELFLMEKAILRRITPDTPVTTNLLGLVPQLDYNQWAKEVDFVAWDNYPDPVDIEAGCLKHAIGNDLQRSLGDGAPYVLMEQATSAVNWRDVNMPKPPGLMRLWSYQTLARGGDGIMYFQWRASVAGTEKYHSAMVPHVGAERSRVYREVADLGNELTRLKPIAGSRVCAQAAILFDWDNWWSLSIDSRPAQLDYPAAVEDVHEWFYQQNIAVDIVAPTSDLTRYSVVVAPHLYMLDDAVAGNLTAFVEQGGALLVTPFSAIVDRYDHVQPGGYGAKLKEVLGLWVEEWCPYPEGRGNAMQIEEENLSFACHSWAEVVHTTTAIPLARFADDYFAGSAALTVNHLGAGCAYYLATIPERAGLDVVLRKVVTEAAGLRPLLLVPQGVEVSLREGPRATFLFLLNHTLESVHIDLKNYHGRDLLSDRVVAGGMNLDPWQVAIIQLAPAPSDGQNPE